MKVAKVIAPDCESAGTPVSEPVKWLVSKGPVQYGAALEDSCFLVEPKLDGLDCFWLVRRRGRSWKRLRS